MFGPGDAFLTPLLAMLRQMPAFPLFGGGKTKLQPAYVEDVAEAIVRVLQTPTAHQVYELAGPQIYTYRELLRNVGAAQAPGPSWSRSRFAYGICWDMQRKFSPILRSPGARSN